MLKSEPTLSSIWSLIIALHDLTILPIARRAPAGFSRHADAVVCEPSTMRCPLLWPMADVHWSPGIWTFDPWQMEDKSIYLGGGGSAPIWCSNAKRSGTPQCSTSFPLLKRQISTTSIATGLPERGSVPVALQRAQTVSSVWTQASNVSFRSLMLLRASSIWAF